MEEREKKRETASRFQTRPNNGDIVGEF